MLTLIAATLGLLIVVIEMVRPKNHRLMDFFGFLSLLYFIVFVVCPIMVAYFSHTGLADSGFGWLKFHTLEPIALVYGEIYALAGYLLLFFGYCGSGGMVSSLCNGFRRTDTLSDIDSPCAYSQKSLFICGTLLAVVGGSSLLIYARELGGFIELIRLAGPMRSDNPPVITPYAFLKNISPLLLSSSFFYYALWKDFKKPRRTWFYGSLFFVTFLLSLVQLFHMAGRLGFVSYVVTFPLVSMMIRGRLKIRPLLFGLGLAVFVILFGKQFAHIIIDPEAISRKILLLGSEKSSVLVSILSEFAFPLVSIANTVCFAVPYEVPYHLFVDFPLAIAYLVPKRIFHVNLPETADSFNFAQFNGPMPIDLISFGYYSGGVIGVVLQLLIFGATLRMADRLFSGRNETIIEVFRVAWMLFLGFRIMYGGPVISLKIGFYLVIGTALLLLCRRRDFQREAALNTRKA
ncbi:hypothetical protein [Syntrophotalea carbinolica]|nr:hypothetical protein [Syntrophotalea carbinolica]